MKKHSMAPILRVFLFLAGALIICAAAFLPSAHRQLTALQAEIRLMESQAQLYEVYVQDPSAIEQEVQWIKMEIEEIREDYYIDEFRISFAISDAVKAYDTSLLSLSLGNVTSYRESPALPVQLTVRGSTENVLQFVRHFETNTEASYLLRGVSLDIGAERTDASLVLYVCAPEL